MVSTTMAIAGIVFVKATATGENSEKLLLGIYAFVVTIVVLVAVTRLYRLR